MDKFRNLKFIGYCMAKIPSEDFGFEYGFEDFVNYCKFQLCLVNHKLMKDPIWESYSDEEILSEYYAHAVAKDDDFATKVIQSVQGADLNVYDWLDDMIKQNQEEMSEHSKDLEDEIEFEPTSLGE